MFIMIFNVGLQASTGFLDFSFYLCVCVCVRVHVHVHMCVLVPMESRKDQILYSWS